MNTPPELPEIESDHGESVISSKEELAQYLVENPNMVKEVIREMADYFVGDGELAIEEILEKGYEDSVDIDDLLNLHAGPETVVLTPYIDAASDWYVPFEDRFYISSPFPEGVEIDDDLVSDFSHALLQSCIHLIERTGKSRPNSAFVDVFGIEVNKFYRIKLLKELANLREERAKEDRRLQEERSIEDGELRLVWAKRGFLEEGSRSLGENSMWSDWLAEYRILNQIKNAVSEETTPWQLWKLMNEESDKTVSIETLWRLQEGLNGELEQVTFEGMLWEVGEALNKQVRVSEEEHISQIQEAQNIVTGALHYVRQACQEPPYGQLSLSRHHREVYGYPDLPELTAEFLSYKRAQEDIDLQEQREEEDNDGARRIHGDALSAAITDAVPSIASWIKETIEAVGDSLVVDALRICEERRRQD